MVFAVAGDIDNWDDSIMSNTKQLANEVESVPGTRRSIRNTARASNLSDW